MKKLLLIICCYLALGYMQAQIITTIAGNGISGYCGDNIPATSAEFRIPNGIAIDQFGNIFIADVGNNRIRKINTLNNMISTIAGNGTMGYSGDGSQATLAELTAKGVACDAIGNLYIADSENNVIRKITISTGIITTIAGTGTGGYTGDGGFATAAQLTFPTGVVIDTSGNLYFSGNYVIRKITISTGIITTVAGTGTAGYSGDGGMATLAELSYGEGLCFDKLNNLYIVDSDNNVIRKLITSTGIITTIAGNGTAGYIGDGGQATAAELYIPADVVLDSLNNLYISDSFNNVIRKINANGIISTIIGIGIAGFSGDGGLAINAEINSPYGITLDKHDNLYIVDYGNNRVRKISNVSSITGIAPVAGNNGQVILFPNPANNIVQVAYTGSIINISICDMLGKEVPIPNPSQRKGNSMNIDVSNLSEGVYFVKVEMNDGITTKKVVVQH